MNELYEAIEKKIKSSGYPRLISGEDVYDDICDQIEGKENGEYILLSKFDDDVVFEYHITIQDDDFNLGQIEVEDDVTAYLEFPNGATGVFVTPTADAPGTNRFEITLERGKLVAEHDNLTFFELEQNERDFCFTATGGFEQPAGHEVTIELDGKNPQHVGVLNAFAGAILRGEPLVADGTEGIRGLELSNAMHLSSWTDQTVTQPIDEALFLEKLNEHRKVSKVKTEVTEATFDTSDSYGSKVSDNTDKGGVNA